MKRGTAGWGDKMVVHESSRTSTRRGRAWALTGVAAGTLLVGATMMPTTVAAEGEVVVESSVTAPSVTASPNCVGANAWSATWVVTSNAGDTGSWQLNAGAFQSTATNFVIEDSYSLDEASASFSATVSFAGGAQRRPVAASADRPESCISAPPPPTPDVETETASRLAESDVAADEPTPSVISSSNCSGSEDWMATWVISSNAGDGGTWQLADGAPQSTSADFIVEEIFPLDDASASLATSISYAPGPQAVQVSASVDRPTACILATPPVVTVPAVEVFAPAAVASPSATASATPDLAQTLPATGNETTILALLAMASLGAGMLLLGASRRTA
jgi:LPXTG-motif cell wall-anchored protein